MESHNPNLSLPPLNTAFHGDKCVHHPQTPSDLILESHSPSDQNKDIMTDDPPPILIPVPSALLDTARPFQESWLCALDCHLVTMAQDQDAKPVLSSSFSSTPSSSPTNWPISRNGNSHNVTTDVYIHSLANGAKKTTGLFKWHGTCSAKLVLRDIIRDQFVTFMSADQDSLRRLARDLFDRYGRLRSEFTLHPVRRGSGIWGNELSDGDILLFESVNVDIHLNYRAKGRAIFALVLAEAEKLSKKFVVLTSVGSTIEHGAFRSPCQIPAEDMATDLVRSLGFRRVGNSHWFAYTSDKSHPSWGVEAKDDYNPPQHNCTAQALESYFQLQPADSETSSVDLLGRRWETLPHDQVPWYGVDQNGRTILHLAAINVKLAPLRWMLENLPGLAVARDKAGYTPLEALRASLDIKRILQPDPAVLSGNIVKPDEFNGFTVEECDCIIALVLATDLGSHRSREQIRFGCTCGQCIKGYLSPRMSQIMQYHSARTYFSMAEEAELFDANNPSDSCYFNIVQTGGPMAKLHPHFLIQRFAVSGTARHGFANAFGYVSSCLSEGIVPTDEAIDKAKFASTQYQDFPDEFTDYGGTYKAVRRMTFAIVTANIEWMDRELKPIPNIGLEALPHCRNDSEFDFVERRIHLDSGLPVLPSDLAPEGWLF